MVYTKKNPSKEYLQNVKYYKEMHENGFLRIDEFVSSKDAYSGISTKPFVNIIKKIIDINECKSLLDYGCGKAKYYYEGFQTDKGKYPCLKDYWNIEVNLYDPCFKKYNILTKNKVDITICIDVLEHIPNQDIDWILKDFISITNKIVFINVACYKASATLPNGKNAHVNIQTYEWWEKKLIECALIFKDIKILAFCTFISKKNKRMIRCIEINDSYGKYT